MSEPSDQLAYALYQHHRQINNLRSDWGDLNSTQKNEWRSLAALAIEFCQEFMESEEVTNG